MINFGNVLRRRTRLDAEIARDFFDADYYVSENPDVAREAIDPFIHYITHGWREGRNPSSDFSTLYYKDKYLSKRRKPINPLVHYAGLDEGKRDRVTTSPGDDLVRIQVETVRDVFDEAFYAGSVQLGPGSDALVHYLTKGWRQGLEPRRSFSSPNYLSHHTHVRRQDLNPFYHFVSTHPLLHAGKPASREPKTVSPTPVIRVPRSAREQDLYDRIGAEFDATFYLARNGDVREAGLDPLEHFVKYGAWENRNPNEIFWLNYYCAKYADEIEKDVNPFYHYLKVGRDLGYRPNPYGDSLWPKVEAPEPASWRGVVPAADIADADVVLIMPVYKGYDDTLAAIHSVLSNPQQARFALLVIDDCGPEARLTSELKALAGRGLFAHLRNETNLGFVQTVNRGLEVAAGKDVVLLNADIVLYGDWLDRLLRHAAADQAVATITPFSNNATICSYPDVNVDNRLQLEVTPAELDAFTAICNAGGSSSVPTGVGFCFYMRRAIIDEIGILDAETFGKGYGEENDFCMRASARGYTNLLAHDVFVFHSGSVSFGNMLVEKSRSIFATLLGKHPNYESKIRNHVAVDPARLARQRLDYYRFAKRLTRKPAILVSHKSGGGIETHIAELGERLDQAGFDVIVMRIAGPTLLEVSLPDKSSVDFPAERLGQLSLSKDVALLTDLLQWVAPQLVHVHSFVKLNWASTTTLMALIAEYAPRYYYTLHDYSSVCHRNHLLTPEHLYCGRPDDRVCRSCIRSDAEIQDYIDPTERRQRYEAFLASARQVFAPSADVVERVGAHIALTKARVRPHEETRIATPWRTARAPSRILKIATIGAVGKHKGADVLYSLAVDARARALPINFMIVGYSYDPALTQSVGIWETGRYTDDATAMRILNDEKADLVLLPSIWPETFSYTLSLALAAGVPPVVFDLGAPADRLRTLGQGQILDAGLAEDPKRLNDALLALDLDALWSRRQLPPVVRYDRFERDYYGLDAAETRASPGDAHSAFGP